MTDETTGTIRPAGPADAAAMAALQAEVWRTAYAGLLPEPVVAGFTPAAFEPAWRASLGADLGGHVLLLAEDAGRLVGYAAFGPATDEDADAETAELLLLGVAAAERRRGHGSRLLNAVADTARSRGITWLDAWVLVDDAPTQAFLRGAGMVPDQARRQRVVDDEGHDVMEVRLGASLGPVTP